MLVDDSGSLLLQRCGGDQEINITVLYNLFSIWNWMNRAKTITKGASKDLNVSELVTSRSSVRRLFKTTEVVLCRYK